MKATLSIHEPRGKPRGSIHAAKAAYHSFFVPVAESADRANDITPKIKEPAHQNGVERVAETTGAQKTGSSNKIIPEFSEKSNTSNELHSLRA